MSSTNGQGLMIAEDNPYLVREYQGTDARGDTEQDSGNDGNRPEHSSSEEETPPGHPEQTLSQVSDEPQSELHNDVVHLTDEDFREMDRQAAAEAGDNRHRHRRSVDQPLGSTTQINGLFDPVSGGSTNPGNRRVRTLLMGLTMTPLCRKNAF
ncbi:hypothetical protein BJV82DRAFT_670373 [Fennellomyces sp. T-0311]|nr:hypothetical protein BJV82DRAFT_670373 [Fennellomyces sp. T-0311]